MSNPLDEAQRIRDAAFNEGVERWRHQTEMKKQFGSAPADNPSWQVDLLFGAAELGLRAAGAAFKWALRKATNQKK